MSKLEEEIKNFLQNNLGNFDLPLGIEAPQGGVNTIVNQGHLVSDVVIRCAQARKQSPESIAKLLLPHLVGVSKDFHLSLDSGYLNIFIENFTPEILKQFQIIPKTRIFFPLSGSGRTDSIFLRLLSLAISQLIFSKNQAEIIVISATGVKRFSKISMELLQLSLELNNSNVEDYLLTEINKSDLERKPFSILWLSPEQLSKREISRLYQSSLGQTGELQIQIPHASWLKDLDREIVVKYREIQVPQNLMKIIILLSGIEPSSELYFDEAILPVRNSLSWYLQTTAQRLSNLGVKSKNWELPFQVSSLPADLSGLVWSLLMLPAHQHHAVTKGSIPSFIAKVYDFLDQLNYFFNSPQLRQKLLSNNCNQFEKEILSGGLALVQELSCAIKV